VSELKERFQSMRNCVLLDYQGMTGEEATEFRRRLDNEGISCSVIRNALADIALKETGHDLGKYLVGPTAVASEDDSIFKVLAALKSCGREIRELPVRGGIADGDVLSKEQLDELGNVPSKDVLYGQVIGALVGPLQGFVGVLDAILYGCVGVLDALVQLKQES